ncbi:hypothetical protein, partial [Adonisia turfae]|uniref:hypothetical protein n=1 Tax=Adonisia turfae TaxID=2950184 RepID=UPI002029B3EB
MNEIERAERARIGRQSSDLVWGTHYRKTGTHWQVNPIELDVIVKTLSDTSCKLTLNQECHNEYPRQDRK